MTSWTVYYSRFFSIVHLYPDSNTNVPRILIFRAPDFYTTIFVLAVLPLEADVSNPRPASIRNNNTRVSKNLRTDNIYVSDPCLIIIIIIISTPPRLVPRL